MEIRPILSAMWRNRTGSILVAIQVALTLAIVTNCMFMAKSRIDFIARPSGMDVENIITVQSLGFGLAYEHGPTIVEDLRLLRAIPGVVSASSVNSIPMSGSGSATGFRAGLEEDAPRETANYYVLDEHAVETLGVNMIEGRPFHDYEILDAGSSNGDMTEQVIITQAYAEKLFGDESAIGQRVYDGLGESGEVVGVVEHMFGAWVSWSGLSQVLWFPRRPTGPAVRYLVRAEPGQLDSLMPVIEKTLADSNRNRLVRNVRSMQDAIAGSYAGDRAIAVVLFVAVVMLFVITGLGIVGLASFAVRQRTKQIGTRRAIGARKRDIIRYFLTENWLMTTIGLTIGTFLTIGLNYFLAAQFSIERLDITYLVGGVFALWVLGFLAVAEPARRASKISPAIATRTV
ncbi:MAG: FtsX-like permease family protein [Pseudomonadota bacterium]